MISLSYAVVDFVCPGGGLKSENALAKKFLKTAHFFLAIYHTADNLHHSHVTQTLKQNINSGFIVYFQKDKTADLAARWKHCAITQEPLQQPIMACELGR